MLNKLLMVMILYALVEVCTLIYVGGLIGGFHLLLILLASALLGAWMIKQQGLLLIQKFRQDFEQRRVPSEPLIDGAGLLIGGLLLMLPGLISDLAGIILLIPAVRVVLVRRTSRWIRERMRSGEFTFHFFRR
ncbi:FxsA family protein [Sporolactobacillus terrae]|uniref:Membrane protein FxsA n=1 Tax=Sporolactobacillus terrae TaxID=269673 RepID=A0ABX5Q8P5_9BACL|nr:FxsA family protein [Sporolactobacillus terrae]QAA23010.1 hypothetical protein C0674_10450 [Sporolactobacillus terrae]QAA25983.1 hypothetical protein C0679_10430 [Sporolactobacillus terrae]UAK15080.1 FxsA family protein [Sporolactobacillus terrae]